MPSHETRKSRLQNDAKSSGRWLSASTDGYRRCVACSLTENCCNSTPCIRGKFWYNHRGKMVESMLEGQPWPNFISSPFCLCTKAVERINWFRALLYLPGRLILWRARPIETSMLWQSKLKPYLLWDCRCRKCICTNDESALCR